MSTLQSYKGVVSKAVLCLTLTFVIVIFLTGVDAYAQSSNTSDANMFDEPERMSANVSNATSSNNITVFDEPAP
jgi:hypothetical protein